MSHTVFHMDTSPHSEYTQPTTIANLSEKSAPRPCQQGWSNLPSSTCADMRPTPDVRTHTPSLQSPALFQGTVGPGSCSKGRRWFVADGWRRLTSPQGFQTLHHSPQRHHAPQRHYTVKSRETESLSPERYPARLVWKDARPGIMAIWPPVCNPQPPGSVSEQLTSLL